MSADEDMQRAVLTIKRAGRSTELVVALLDGGNYSAEDLAKVRKAMHGAMSRNTLDKTVLSPTTRTFVERPPRHMWVDTGGLMASACGLKQMLSPTILLAAMQHGGKRGRWCQNCMRASYRDGNVPVTLRRLKELADIRTPAHIAGEPS